LWYTVHMTTITINEDLGFDRNAFGSLSELLAYLEEHGLMVVLQELSGDAVTDDMKKNAKEASKQYKEDPSSFTSL